MFWLINKKVFFQLLTLISSRYFTISLDEYIFFNVKFSMFSYPLVQIYVLGAQRTVSRFFLVPTTYVLVYD